MGLSRSFHPSYLPAVRSGVGAARRRMCVSRSKLRTLAMRAISKRAESACLTGGKSLTMAKRMRRALHADSLVEIILYGWLRILGRWTMYVLYVCLYATAYEATCRKTYLPRQWINSTLGPASGRSLGGDRPRASDC